MANSNVTKKVNAANNPADVDTIDGIIKALYESISFKVGSQPDFGHFRLLVHPNGLLVPPKSGKETHTNVMDIETFIKYSVEYIVMTGLERKGLIEKEIARRIQSFGNIVQVFSTFESRNFPVSSDPIYRGIRSIQLLRESQRWWILSIIWELERPNMPIPKAYLV